MRLVLFYLLIIFSVSVASGSNTKYDNDSIEVLLVLASDSYLKGDYDKTEYYINKTHAIRLAQFPLCNKEVALSYINMAHMKMITWEYDDALFNLEKAEEIYHNCLIDDVEIIGKVYLEMGKVYFNTGDYDSAKNFYKQALYSFEEKDNYYTYTMNSIAKCEQQLQNKAHALDIYIDIESLFEKYNIKDVMIKTEFYISFAYFYTDMKEYDKSIELLNKAIHVFGSDSVLYADYFASLRNNLGSVYLDAGYLKEAYNNLLIAIRMFDMFDNRGFYAIQAYNNLGRYYIKTGDYLKASNCLQYALYLLTNNKDYINSNMNPSGNELGDKITALYILRTKVDNQYHIYQSTKKIEDLNSALNTAYLAINIIDELNNSYQSYESKVLTREYEYDIYPETMDILWEAYQTTGNPEYLQKCFWVSEKSKASVLLSSLNELDARQFANIPDDVIQKETQLNKDIAFYKNNLYTSKSNEQVDSVKVVRLENTLFKLQKEHNELINTLEANYPEYYELKYNRSVAGISSIQNSLNLNTTLLQYSFSDSCLYTFCISRNDVSLVCRAMDSTFQHTVDAYLKLFHDFDFTRQTYDDFNTFTSLGKTLFDILITPVHDKINGDQLIIVPDGILSYLPFETIISRLPNGNGMHGYKHLNYLLNEYSVSYAYSSSFLEQISSSNKIGNSKKLLAFAPQYSSNYLADIKDDKPSYRKELNPIPGAIDEVNNISTLIPTDIFLAETATESNFNNVVSAYDILHLSMHALIDNVNPMYSKLVFSMESDSISDGMLNTYELFDLNLKAQLVVLSACNTGKGIYNKGEGVMSMARGFAYAGTPSMLMTMWEVEDMSGAALMYQFYKGLMAGKCKDKALRDAKLHFIDNALPEYSHPFFWSTYILQGNSTAIFSKNYYRTMALVTMCIVFIAVAIYRRRKN